MSDLETSAAKPWSLDLGRDWAAAVCAVCDPVMAAADVGFERHGVQETDSGQVRALLWEADPTRFAARYPDSGLVESYGEDQWPMVTCLDYWVYVDAARAEAWLSVEGWNLPDRVLALTGDGERDGQAIGHALAGILRVPPPA